MGVRERERGNLAPKISIGPVGKAPKLIGEAPQAPPALPPPAKPKPTEREVKSEAEYHVLWLTNESGVPDGGALAREGPRVEGPQFLALTARHRLNIEQLKRVPHVASSSAALFSCTAPPTPEVATFIEPDEFTTRPICPAHPIPNDGHLLPFRTGPWNCEL